MGAAQRRTLRGHRVPITANQPTFSTLQGKQEITYLQFEHILMCETNACGNAQQLSSMALDRMNTACCVGPPRRFSQAEHLQPGQTVFEYSIKATHYFIYLFIIYLLFFL
jgi:hypothetical protein